MNKDSIIDHLENHNYHEEKRDEAIDMIDKYKDRIEALRGLSAVSYDEELVDSGNKISDPTFNTVAAIRDIEDELCVWSNEMKEYSKMIITVHNWLNILNKNEREIIESFYIKNMPWSRLTNSIGYSESHCKAIRKKGIDKIIAYCKHNTI